MRILGRILTRRCVRYNAELIELQEQYLRFKPRPLSGTDFVQFARSGNRLGSFMFIREELPTRWMQLLAEMRLLPIRPTPIMLEIKESFEQTINEVLPYTQLEPTEEVIERYNQVLEGAVQRHKYAVDEAAIAILEFKEVQLKNGTDADLEKLEERVHYFLDRFFTNLVAGNLIIHQHLHYLSGISTRERYARGTFQTTNVTAEINGMAKKAMSECSRYYGHTANVIVTNVDGEESPENIKMTFVPDHLNRIVYELIRNALRATVEKCYPQLPPVHVVIAKGKSNICLKISDRGGGASLKDQAKWGAYLYSSPPEESKSKEANVTPLAGYGYGIPLSEVYARYLGGDVNIRSIENYGTDVFIYLPAEPDKLLEYLPIFSTQSEAYYKQKQQKPTWVSGKDSDITFDTN